MEKGALVRSLRSSPAQTPSTDRVALGLSFSNSLDTSSLASLLWECPPSWAHLEPPPPMAPTTVPTAHSPLEEDGAENMQTHLIKAGSQTSISLCDSPSPHNAEESGVKRAFILCQMEEWAAEEKEQLSLVPNVFWGVPHTAVSSPCRLPLHPQALDYPLSPEAFTVLNFLIMACLCLGTWDHMASIESVTRLRFGI